MRFFRVLTVIIITTISGIILHSCCDGYKYRFTYIISKNIAKSQRTRNIVETTDSVSSENYGIRIHFFNQKIAGRLYIPSNSNLYAAYDCWPIFPMEDSIMDIRILTLNQLNAGTHSGEDVTKLFRSYFHVSEQGLPLGEVISDINKDDMSVVDFFDAMLIDTASVEGWHQFIVNVLLSDNRVMTDTTEPIKFYK